MEQEPELYEKLIYENEPKAYQLRLVVNEFRDVQYVHLRKYFLSYEGEYVPSKDGISMEASLYNIMSLLDGLMEIVSHEEAKAVVKKHFEDKLNAKSDNHGSSDS